MSQSDVIMTGTIGVKFPAPMKAYLESQAAKCGCADISEFVISVLEDHQYRKHKSEIEAILLERIDGPFEEWTDHDMEDIRREGTSSINQGKGK